MHHTAWWEAIQTMTPAKIAESPWLYDVEVAIEGVSGSGEYLRGYTPALEKSQKKGLGVQPESA